MDALKKRLDKHRPMKTVNVPLPEDVIDDSKRVAPQRGFSSYQALLRTYIGQGLRDDLERLEPFDLTIFTENLRKRGVTEDIITSALADVDQTSSKGE